jgi:hypothetical protein
VSLQRERPPACEPKDELLDMSLADTFPSSDPPSTVHPSADDSERLRKLEQYELIAELPVGSWAAISIEDQCLAATGATREEAEEKARQGGHLKLWLVQVPESPEPPAQVSKAA